MNLLKLSFKNATIKWWRSVTLGFFILSVSMVMVLSSAFITAAKNKVDNVILKGMTGNIQIHSQGSMETDMATQYSQGWDSLEPMSTKAITDIGKVLKSKFPELKPFLMTRHSSFLVNQEKREETMLIGIEPGFESYKEAFQLSKGRYLEPGATDEILLTDEQAAAFKVDIGDMITVSTKNMYGLNAQTELKVVGIGNYIMLSLFSYKADYTSSETVGKLVGMDAGEATEMILFTGNSGAEEATISRLSKELQDSGMETLVTKYEKLKSEDLQIKEFDLTKLDEKDDKVMISGFSEMGNSFKGVSDIMFTMLNILVVFLIVIVSILIINLVYMAGIERYREIGTLRAIGLSRFQVIRVFMGEIVFVSMLSGIIGVLSSTGLVLLLDDLGIASPIPAMDYIMGKTLSLEIVPSSILNILLIITGLSLAASFYPAYKACSIDPAESIRTV